MATKTSNYEFNKPEQNDFYDVDVQNENWDKVDEELSEFDDSGVTEDIKSFPDFLSKFVTGNKVAITLRNLKAGLQFVLHAGQIVNNCVTDNAGLPLSAAQGKALMDKYTQLYSDLNTTNNNLSKYDRKKLNDGDNLNVKLGPYRSASNNIVGSLLNKPTQVLNGEVTIDWYPSNDNSNYGTQILRHTRDNTINIYFRAKKGSVDNWSEWINLATKDDLDKKVSSRIALDWSNKPTGLLITVDGQKRLIPSSVMQILT